MTALVLSLVLAFVAVLAGVVTVWSLTDWRGALGSLAVVAAYGAYVADTRS